MGPSPDSSYLLAGQASELERLRLQSRVWEGAGRKLLKDLALPGGAQVLDVGCGALGWLRVLHEKVADTGGRVVGSDVDRRLLDAAATFVAEEGLQAVEVVEDDLFDSRLPASGFDLVHARFQLAPLGRVSAQIDAYLRLLKPGGWLVLEDPDSASWRLEPEAPAHRALVELILRAFTAGGGRFDQGRALPALLRERGIEPRIGAHVHALAPGHPYLRLPLQFATALRPRLQALMGEQDLADLLTEVEAELARPGTWGTTFTLVQAWGRKKG